MELWPSRTTLYDEGDWAFHILCHALSIQGLLSLQPHNTAVQPLWRPECLQPEKTVLFPNFQPKEGQQHVFLMPAFPRSEELWGIWPGRMPTCPLSLSKAYYGSTVYQLREHSLKLKYFLKATTEPPQLAAGQILFCSFTDKLAETLSNTKLSLLDDWAGTITKIFWLQVQHVFKNARLGPGRK